jgi:hypothetical protein
LNPGSATATYISPKKLIFWKASNPQKKQSQQPETSTGLTNILSKILCFEQVWLSLHLFFQQLAKQLTDAQYAPGM